MAAQLIALLLCSLSALATEGDTDADADRASRLERAAVLKADAASRRREADALLASQQAECAKRFLVNACLDDAKTEHLRSILEVRRLEDEGEAIERDIRQEDAKQRDIERAAETERRETDRAEREPRVAAERQKAEEATAKRLAEKERKAAEGARHKVAEAEKQRRKQAEHAARVAKKKQQTERTKPP